MSKSKGWAALPILLAIGLPAAADTPAVRVAAGAYHTCAILAGGNVKCWGYNAYGQLGAGHTNNLGDNPGEVFGGMFPAVIETQKIVAGDYHTCALKYGGAVWCWGYNAYGQLGVGDTANRGDNPGEIAFNLPPAVELGMEAGGFHHQVIGMAAGHYHTCAILGTGAIKCWGYNALGQLGLGDSTNRGTDPAQMGDALPEVDL